MSVNFKHYIVWGKSIPYAAYQALSDEDADALNDEYGDPKEGEIGAIADGMNGEHFIIGKVLAKVDEADGFDPPVLLDERNPKLLASFQETNVIRSLLAKLGHPLEGAGYIVFTHWQ